MDVWKENKNAEKLTKRDIEQESEKDAARKIQQQHQPQHEREKKKRKTLCNRG